MRSRDITAKDLRAVDPGGRRQTRPRSKRDSPATDALIDERRERILKVAEELFFTKGFDGTSMDAIVAQLGVTKPYVYYYFNSKQAIFEALCWRPTVACFTVFDGADIDPRPAHEKLADGIERLIGATITHYPAAFFTHLHPHAASDAFRSRQIRLAHGFYDQLCGLLNEAREDGKAKFEDTKITALAACSLPGFLFTWYRPDGRLSEDAVTKELARLAYRVMGLQVAERRRRLPRTVAPAR